MMNWTDLLGFELGIDRSLLDGLLVSCFLEVG